jgi:hypothetical protein
MYNICFVITVIIMGLLITYLIRRVIYLNEQLEKLKSLMIQKIPGLKRM